MRPVLLHVLIDMGVPAYLVSSSVVAIMAQRLVRVVCQKCKHPYTPNEALMEAAGITHEMAAHASFAKGTGCGNCSGTGFRGVWASLNSCSCRHKIRELTFNAAPTERSDVRQSLRG